MRTCLVVSLVAITLTGIACREQGTVVVKSLSFNGVTAVDEGRLRNALATRQSSRLPWGRKSYFNRNQFDQDLKRIQAFYADRGYADARVTGTDVQLNDEQDAVEITLTIEEGEPVRIAAVEFVGFEVITPGHLDDIRERMPLAMGEPRDRQEVNTTHELAVNELRDHGYPYAKVQTAEVSAGARQVTIRFEAEPGVLARFGDVEIQGNRSVSENVIRRQLTFKPGDLYRRSVVQDTQRRLYGMALFQFVNVETVDPEKQDPVVRTRVTVAEGNHQRVNFGVGYGTEEHARLEGEYQHVNFLGGARSAGVQARWSSLDRGLRGDFRQPYVFMPKLSLAVEGQHWYTFTPAYESIVSGGRVTLVDNVNRFTTVSVSFQHERTRSEISSDLINDLETYLELRDDLIALGLDPTTNSQAGVLNAIGANFSRSTADSLLNPTRGYQVAFHVESGGRFLPGTFDYAAVSADGRHYVPIGERVVIANRLQLGSIDDRGDDPGNVPFSRKFFLGGASSMRGWGRYEVSPLSGSGLPLGGNSLFALSTEVRATVAGNLGGVIFADAGNVWREEWDFSLDDLRYDVGVGLRYRTPVGPIRLDYGYQINPIPGLVVEGDTTPRRWRIHFSIGQAF
jgi:outer membrane protein insertion porin family/translocation and assembly module TamA